MKQKIFHAWNLDTVAARRLQSQLAKLVVTEDIHGPIRSVAGVDAAYSKTSPKIAAAAVVLDAKSFLVLEKAVVLETTSYPYIPGLFAFRELPAVITALQALKLIPDLIVCDGHGLAHPRRFGLACHLGVLLDIPTIGCAKTPFEWPTAMPGPKRGSQAPIQVHDEIVGCALRTQTSVKPVYVSLGHQTTLQTGCRFILQLSPYFRLPETTRLAHQFAQAALKEY